MSAGPGNEKRIETLDGFRFLSITMVVFFHYLSRWTAPEFDGNYYPYKNQFAHTGFFEHGAIGVPFFFIISGFVILFTLERTKSLKDFMIRRMIRLWPTMLLCSLLTFGMVKLLDPAQAFKWFEVRLLNFLPGLSFTPTSLWGTQFIDSSYWSLVVEVQFYIWAGLSFFFFRKHFVPIWALGALAVFLISRIMGAETPALFDFFLFPSFIMYFAAGILFYRLFSGIRDSWTVPAILAMYVAGVSIEKELTNQFFVTAFFLLFFLFVYKDGWLGFLRHPLILAIGVASYPLYLLHQHAGVLWIGKLSQVLPLTGNWQLVYPLAVYGLMCGFSYLLYRFFEIPVKHICMRLYKGKPKVVRPEGIKIPVREKVG